MINRGQMYDVCSSVCKRTSTDCNTSRSPAQGRSADEADLLLQACFEHYPSVRGAPGFDPALARTGRVCNWAVFQDMLQTRVQAEQQHSLLSYLPFAAMSFHYDFSCNDNAFMRWPRVQQEFDGALKMNGAILSECLTNCPAAMQRLYSPRMFRLDVVRLPLL